MGKEHVNAADAYAPPWHFKQAVKVTEGTSVIFLSALAGYKPDGTLAESDVVAQAESAFENSAKVVPASDGTLADVVKTTVNVREDFLEYRDAHWAIRSRYFTEDYPASTLVQVVGFANPDYLSQIEAIAVIN